MKSLRIISLFTIIGIAFLFNVQAQDIIVFRNGEEKEAVVKKVGISTIEYLRYDNIEGALYEVLKDNVFMIRYKSGAEDYFEVTNKSIDKKQVNKGVFIDDRDSIMYSYVRIGKQVWMGENLRFNDLKSPCSPSDDKDCKEYGRYYYYYDALVACPDGWHLPSDEEWMDLEIEAGMSKAEAAKYGWRGTGIGQASALLTKGQTGLNLIFGGYITQGNLSRKKPRYDDNLLNEVAYYWTSTEDKLNKGEAYIRQLKDRASIKRYNYFKKNRYSVRCVKDSQ